MSITDHHLNRIATALERIAKVMDPPSAGMKRFAATLPEIFRDVPIGGDVRPVYTVDTASSGE